MSRRSRHRRKEARRSYRPAREAPRATSAHAGAGTVTYPSVHDLLASGPGWREFLETALRCVLRPAALVSAVGLVGCGAQPHAASLSGDTTTVQSASQSTGTGAVLVPMPPGAGDGLVVDEAIPPCPTSHAPPVQQTLPVPPLHRPLPGTLHGTPLPQPVAVRGEMVAVDPQPLPTPDPIPLGGAPMPVTPDPAPPPPTPTPDHAAPVVPSPPEPVPMPGGARVVMPSS